MYADMAMFGSCPFKPLKPGWGQITRAEQLCWQTCGLRKTIPVWEVLLI